MIVVTPPLRLVDQRDNESDSRRGLTCRTLPLWERRSQTGQGKRSNPLLVQAIADLGPSYVISKGDPMLCLECHPIDTVVSNRCLGNKWWSSRHMLWKM